MLAYIDETGDHNLINIDPQYPLFALGALLVTETEYAKMDEAVRKIKEDFFGDKAGTFILHSSELKRPLHDKSDKRNLAMLDTKTRASFYKNFDQRIIKAFDYKIITCFIRKRTMADTYVYPADPYHFSFENLLNRIIRYGDEFNKIYAEKRGDELNAELMSEYERLKKVGIHSYSADAVSTKTSLKLIDKKENNNGLQVMDLILSSLARKRLGKELKMVGNDLDPKLIELKYACPPTVFPQKPRK